MNCKYCGTENPEGAIYCKSCGKRVDGMTTCHACGKEIPGDSAFCIYCGASVPTEYAVTPTDELVKTDENTEEVNESPKWRLAKKILKIISTSAALATAIVSLIFVFLIGITQVASALSASESVQSVNIYYFFGKAFSDMREATEHFKLFYTQDLFNASLYVPVVLGLVISAGTIVSVVTMSIMAIVRCIKNLTGKSFKSGGSLAVAAFMTFVLGAVAILAVQTCKVTGDLSVGYKITFNGATKAGIILGAIFAFIYFGCAVTVRAKEIKKAKVLTKFICSLASIALIIVMFSLLSYPIYSVKDYSGSGMKLSLGLMGVFYDDSSLNSSIGILSIIALSAYDIEKVKEEAIWGEVAALSVVAFVVLIVLLVMAVCALIKHVEAITDDGKKGTLKFNIVATVLSLAFMVLTLVNASTFAEADEYLRNSMLGGEKLKCVIPIVVFVVSVVSLAGSITESCLNVKYGKE